MPLLQLLCCFIPSFIPLLLLQLHTLKKIFLYLLASLFSPLHHLDLLLSVVAYLGRVLLQHDRGLGDLLGDGSAKGVLVGLWLAEICKACNPIIVLVLHLHLNWCNWHLCCDRWRHESIHWISFRLWCCILV